jgi:hypothetical protein
MVSLIDRSDLQDAAKLFADACKFSRTHDSEAAAALRTYGSHGAQISGCVRDHFPDAVKERLRCLARAVATRSDEARRACPARVRGSTINALAREIATRDGSGFYGPQPIRNMAAALAARVAGFSAWNHTSEEQRQIRRARRNGAGLRLTFADGSAAFIPRGSAAVRVVA